MSHSQYSFSQVPKADIPRSTFVRNHSHKSTFDAGYLIPFYVDEALPGDTFKVSANIFCRLATPIVPLMDNMYVDTFWFFVPNRLLWDNWQKMNGEQDNPGDSTDFLVPIIDPPITGFEWLSIFDYMGIPPKVNFLEVSALFPRAYNLIYNEWFRDQNLIDKAARHTDDGPDSQDDYPLRRRTKRHDYFTSALPWPQKGPGVMLPLGDTAPVIPNPDGAIFNSSPMFRGTSNNQVGQLAAQTSNNVVFNSDVDQNLAWATQTGLLADLKGATAATINSLREAFQMQKLLERDARGGTRYTEILRSHFGVTSPDARLQRPEYLGGNSTPVIINPVTQTGGTGTNVDTPQGNLAAYGVLSAEGDGFTKSFVEHGVIIGLLMARADLSYQQGVNRMFTRRTRWDFYWPALSHLGEQIITNREIFAQHEDVLVPPGQTGEGEPVNSQAFGYQERWSEYRYKPSLVTGAMRSGYDPDNTGTPIGLDSWHLAQDFQNLPVLSEAFILEDPPVDRVVAVQDEPHFILDSFIAVTTARPMPLYSVPGLIDHF